jgi:2-hydroxychromene-2-carboxylate isomerase
MRAATYAFAAGRGHAFAMQAYRDAFTTGADLGNRAHVLRAARRAGLDPGEVEAAVADPAVKQALREATDAAQARGVFGVPTIAIGDELFWGDDRLEDAATYLQRGAQLPR